MAEESISPLAVSPESTEMDSNSAEIPSPPPPPPLQSSGARRHSLSVKPDSTKRRVPIHLRASTGSCHDMCKFGRRHYSEEKPREPFRKGTLKPSPKEADFIEVFVPGNKQKEEILNKKAVVDHVKIKTPKSSSSEVKPVKTTVPTEKNQKMQSPRQTILSRDKTPRLPNPNQSLGKKSSNLSEPPEIIKREIILQPSEKVEVSAEEASSSNDNKMLRSDKKTSDRSVKTPSLIKVKPLVASAVLGKKMTSLESPSAARSSPRSYLRKTAPSKAKEAGRVKLSLLSTSPTKFRDGIAKFNGEAGEKDNLNPKARKGGKVKVKPSSTPSSPKGTEVKPDSGDSEKILHVIKTEADNNIASPSSEESPTCATTPFVSSPEENEEMQNTESIETMDEKQAVSIETADKQTTKENHACLTSPSSSSQEAEDGSDLEKTDNKNHPQEIESSQLSEKIHDGSPSSSSHEDGSEEEISPSSSSEISSHARSSSLPSLEENDEQIKSDDSVSDKAKSTEIKKVQPRKLKGKSTINHSEDKNRLPVKLKFRRGRIIELQPENSVPKRLKFRRMKNKSVDFAYDAIKPSTPNRTLRKAKSSVSEIKRPVELKPGTPNRSLRKSHSVTVFENNKNRSRKEKMVDTQSSNKSPTRLSLSRGGRVVSRAEEGKSVLRKKNLVKARGKSEAVGGPELLSGKVVLKHSEVERKSNNDRVLLNNVIEETASKLVENRISKVKALVGAFETVISLQETKPSSNPHTGG